MKNNLRRITLSVAFLATPLLNIGCMTTGQSAALGSLLGAGAGAVIGHQSGETGEGAAIGALLGAGAGAVASPKKRPVSTYSPSPSYYPQPSYAPAPGYAPAPAYVPPPLYSPPATTGSPAIRKAVISY